MRGDSIRDLYAKTLAVAGLAVLALAGAVVDYWPVGGTLPALPPRVVSIPHDSVLAKDFSNEMVNVNAADAMSVPRAPRRATLALVKTLPNAFRPAQPVVFENSAAAIDSALALPADFIRLGDSMPVLATSMVFVDLTEPEPEAEPMLLVSGGSQDDRKFLESALKRGRESLKDARLFLGDKFQGMGNKVQGVVGALRRASPFFSTSPVAPF